MVIWNFAVIDHIRKNVKRKAALPPQTRHKGGLAHGRSRMLSPQQQQHATPIFPDMDDKHEGEQRVYGNEAEIKATLSSSAMATESSSTFLFQFAL